MAPEPHASRNSVIRAEQAGRVPHVDEVDRVALQHRDEQRSEHAHGVADRRPGEGVPPAGGVAWHPSWRTSAPIVRWVWTTPFGSAVVPEV